MLHIDIFLYRLNDAIDFIEEEEFPENAEAIDIIMEPPGEGETSDIDSGDDETPQLHQLSKGQLSAPAEVTVHVREEEEYSSKQTQKKRKRTINWTTETFLSSEFSYEQHLNQETLRTGASEPLDFFNLFFDDTIFEFILKETVAKCGESIEMNELKCVFGVLLASGVCQLPKRIDYWSSNEVKNITSVSQAISVNKFEKLFSNLHFVPMDAIPSGDKFQKIRLLLSRLNKKFEKHGPTTETFSVDETIVPYFGRHRAKQFIRGKPLRFGFKMWNLATSMGYVYHVQPYPGVAEKCENDANLPSSSCVIYYFAKELRQMFPDEVVTITFDNYFTGIELLKALKADFNVTASGTIRRNRIPNCPDLNDIQTERGNMKSW